MLFNKKLLSASDEARLITAIKGAEFKTSGEIRVHIEKSIVGDDVIDAAHKMFDKLNMHHTKDRNGILFYLAIKSKKFAVWGDEGIHQKVNDEFWNSISACAISYFKQNDIITGLEKSIELCGEQLKHHFPIEVDDTNELSNEISY